MDNGRKLRSLNHFVCLRQQLFGKAYPEFIGRGFIQGQVVFFRMFDREIAWICTFQNFIKYQIIARASA